MVVAQANIRINRGTAIKASPEGKQHLMIPCRGS